MKKVAAPRKTPEGAGRMPARVELEIVRRPPGEEASYIEVFSYEPESGEETVATALVRLNERIERERISARRIRWDCSCLQKKCGACAMVIGGRPGLACDARLSGLGERIRLEPLRKFPVVEDLLVDRSAMFRNLERMRLYLEQERIGAGGGTELAYEASRCLQCGCCLEICPNFLPDAEFAGMAGAVPASRLIGQLQEGREREELGKRYRRAVYEGCGKSLACRDICPAGIDIEGLLVNSNAAAVWKRRMRGTAKRERKENGK